MGAGMAERRRRRPARCGRPGPRAFAGGRSARFASAAAAETDAGAAAATERLVRSTAERVGLQDGETILILIRPSLWLPGRQMLLAGAALLIALGVLTLLARGGMGGTGLGWFMLAGAWAATISAAGGSWAGRRYILTDRRVIACSGWLRQVVDERPITAVRTIGVRRGSVLPAGDVVFGMVHEDDPPLRWAVCPEPERVREAAAECVRRYGRHDPDAPDARDPAAPADPFA